MITFSNVSYSYAGDGKKEVQNLNLSIRKGEFLVVTGGSGCGKTTITRMINGLATKFYEGVLEGTVCIDENDVDELPLWEIGKTVGSIFQDPRSQFFASLTEDELAFGCENYGVDKATIEARITDAIDKVRGESLLKREIYPMSSGEKQKLAIASTYAVSPVIYVFDEPSANLDMASVLRLQELMRLLKNKGHTIVVAEHRLYYLTELADRFLFMREGRIVQELLPKDMQTLSTEENNKMGLRLGNLSDCIGKPPVMHSGKKPSLQVQQVSFFYGKNQIFSNLSFEAWPGEIVALVGQNGVGKSTLGQILCGLLKEKSGTILYNGKKMPKNRRRQVSYYVMQNTDCQLFGEDVSEELKLNQKRMDEEEIETVLKRYALWEYRERHPATLSGGQKQRLTLAVADVINPEILILDEPTSGLDGENMRNISTHLIELARQGKTLLVITHDYEFALSTCDRVLMFGEGGCHGNFPVHGNEKTLLALMQEEDEWRNLQ